MIPEGALPPDASPASAASEPPSRTYRLDPERGRIAGFVDGLDAVKQHVRKMLSTERFAHVIYSADIGHEIRPGLDPSVLAAELPRWIREALLQDERVRDVAELTADVDGDRADVSFTVVSVYGSWEERRSFHV